MKKSNTKKEEKKERKARKKLDNPVPGPPPNEKEDPFDFGGMPDRDLKKNLGCG
jgi:hypothetical protein